MSANEIELTFIRCPSCKSLMPSTANKCGMCGFDLMAEDDENQSCEPIKKSRLRKKTFTGSIDELENSDESFMNRGLVISEVSESLSQENQATDDHFEPSVEEEIDTNISLETNEVTQRDKFQDSKFNESVRESRGLRFSEDLREKNSPTSDEVSDQETRGEGETIDSRENRTEVSSQDGAEPVKKKRKRRKKRKRSVEEDSGQEEGKSSVVRRVTPVNRISSSEKNQPMYTSSENIHSLEVKRKEEIDEKSNQNLEEKQVQEINTKAFHQKNKVSVGESHMSRKIEDATLVGWFVNYSTNAKGLSFEIRVGRQFVGRQSLRGDDLIIQDSAVSTPHCLLDVDGSTHVMLQDLMSEQGTYVKKNGNSEYERIDSSIQLEHGDRVKLGSYELVICLIP
jgi:hypothetical protein